MPAAGLAHTCPWRRVAGMIAALGLLTTLGACAATDPLLSQNTWRPMGANDMNIAAQVADPGDLVRGREARWGDGEQAANAILRLRTGHVKALPDSAITDLRVQGSPTSASAP